MCVLAIKDSYREVQNQDSKVTCFEVRAEKAEQGESDTEGTVALVGVAVVRIQELENVGRLEILVQAVFVLRRDEILDFWGKFQQQFLHRNAE